MRFTRFGIALQRLESEDIELVRQWRNSSGVRPYMRYRELIGPNDQKLWFRDLDSERDWYFIARTGETAFALFNIKAIDWTAVCGEAGGFVGESRFIGRPEPAQATLALMDFAFQVLRLQFLKARYSSSLPRIARFNEQLGYVVTYEDEVGFLYSQVTAERYLQCAASLREAALTIHGPAAVLIAPPSSLVDRLRLSAETNRADFQIELR
jgi:RimJ/RimL family protein N-acetyltransferase